MIEYLLFSRFSKKKKKKAAEFDFVYKLDEKKQKKKD